MDLEEKNADDDAYVMLKRLSIVGCGMFGLHRCGVWFFSTWPYGNEHENGRDVAGGQPLLALLTAAPTHRAFWKNFLYLYVFPVYKTYWRALTVSPFPPAEEGPQEDGRCWRRWRRHLCVAAYASL
jgi:hypothetical protein